MRRLTLRILFAAFVASGSVVLIIACVQSVRVAEAQTRPGHGGGGGAGGVALQSSSPGTPQTGNFNITGSATIGGPSFRAIGGGAGLQLTNTAYYTFPSMLALQNLGTGSNPAIDLRAYTNNEGQVLFAHCSNLNTSQHAYCLATIDGLPVTISSLTTATPIPQTSGGTGAGALNCAGGLLTSNGTAQSCVAAPIPQTSGGTGAGALSCTAGQFITSNGTAYSCAAPSSASAYTTWTTASTSAPSVPGSNCNTVIFTGASGLTVGQGCIASSSNAFGTLPLSLTCEVSTATAINFRLCNTGVNAQTPPANTIYYARVFP